MLYYKKNMFSFQLLTLDFLSKKYPVLYSQFDKILTFFVVFGVETS